MSELIKTVSDI